MYVAVRFVDPLFNTREATFYARPVKCDGVLNAMFGRMCWCLIFPRIIVPFQYRHKIFGSGYLEDIAFLAIQVLWQPFVGFARNGWNLNAPSQTKLAIARA